MGVIACDRSGCENVICDNRIDGNNLCDECLAEFRRSIEGRAMPHYEMKEEFQWFLNRPKKPEEQLLTVDGFIQKCGQVRVEVG